MNETYYTNAHIAAYPVEYIAGIDLYNAGEFHAAHDVWEERWMGEVGPDEKLFLQAMIQSAVAFHHLQIGRPGAARRMYLMAKEKFARLNQPVFMSLDLADYQAQLDKLRASSKFVEANRYVNGAHYNQHQLAKRQEADRMEKRLEQMKQKFADLQERARKAGFGSAVYDP